MLYNDEPEEMLKVSFSTVSFYANFPDHYQDKISHYNI